MSNRIIMAAAGASTGVSLQNFITNAESVTMGSTIVPTVAVDSTTKETYIAVRNNIIKLNANGTLAWQRSLSASNIPNVNGLAVLSGFLFAFCSGETTATATLVYLDKTTGSISSAFSYSGIDLFFANRVLLLSDGSYLVLYDDGGFSFAAMSSVSKYSSSNVHQWRSMLYDATEANSYYTQDISVDPSGSIYLLSQKSVAPIIIKMNSDGTIAWQRSYTVAVVTSLTTTIAAASDGLYVFGTNVVNNTYVLTKLNTSTGAVIWERSIAPTGTLIAGVVRVGPDGYIYCSTNLNTAGIGAQDIVIYKFDASGNSVWQRALGTSAADGQTRPREIVFDGLGNYYIAANAPSTSRVYLARLPVDGTLTGTYTPFTYSSVTHTVSTTTLVSTATSTETFASGIVSPTTSGSAITTPTTSYTVTRTLL